MCKRLTNKLKNNAVGHLGCRLFYAVRGEGPPVLLVQGVGLHGDGWLPQVEGLSARYRCLTFDNRGTGRSLPPGVPLSIGQMAEDARVLMDAEGWGSAHVVGHSMGGLIALELALTNPGRVRSLSLLCTFGTGRVPTRLTPWMAWAGLRTRIGTAHARRRAFVEMVMPPDLLATADLDALAAGLAPLYGYDLARQPPVAMKQLAAMRVYSAAERLAELEGIPTLVVSAEHDRIAPPSAGRALAAGIPGARYVEVAGAAHGVTIQCAGRINELLREHFADADGRPSRAGEAPSAIGP